MKKYNKKRRVATYKMKLRIIEKKFMDMLPRISEVPRAMLFGETIEIMEMQKPVSQEITINFTVSEHFEEACKRHDENYTNKINENLTPKS